VNKNNEARITKAKSAYADYEPYEWTYVKNSIISRIKHTMVVPIYIINQLFVLEVNAVRASFAASST
jgi:hypothetical protein